MDDDEMRASQKVKSTPTIKFSSKSTSESKSLHGICNALKSNSAKMKRKIKNHRAILPKIK